MDRWKVHFLVYKKTLLKLKTSPLIVKVLSKELHAWRHQQTPIDITILPLSVRTVIHQQRQIGWKNFLEGLVSTGWERIQQQHLQHRSSQKSPKTWAKDLVKANWTLLQQIWYERNDKLHNTQIILDNEGHKELLRAVKNEMAIGLHQLPIRDFAHMFQIKKKILYNKSVDFLKTWFVTVRLGRELHGDNKLITDEFSTPGPLQKWVGLTNNRIEESQLDKVILKEYKLGISDLDPMEYSQFFTIPIQQLLDKTTEEKKQWFKQIRMEREKINDTRGLTDRFSVKGPLRTWIGLH